MFCSKCGKQIEDNIKSCPYCGNKIIGFKIGNIADTIKKATDTAVNLAQSAKSTANEVKNKQYDKYMEKDTETTQGDTDSVTGSSGKPLYSYEARVGFDNGTLYVYEEYIHFVSSKNKDISLQYSNMAGVEGKLGSLNIYPFNEKPVYISSLPKDAIEELSSYIHEKITSLKAESTEEHLYSYKANIGFDNGTLYVYEEYIHFVSSKNKDISLQYSDMAGVEGKLGSLNIYPFNERPVCITGLFKDAIEELSSYIHEKITSLKAESTGESVYSYVASNGSDNGTLYVYEEYIHFVSSKNKDISLRYSDINKVEEKGRVLEIYCNEDIINIDLPKGATKQLLPYVQERISSVWKAEKPESCFEKSFGLADKILVNDEYKTFIIRHANGKQTPTYYLKDIINYAIKEINKEGDTLSGALMGQYIAGRSGAVLGAKLASGSSNIVQVQCHIIIKTETDSTVLLAKIALPLSGVSRSSSKYTAIKAEEMKLEEYLKAVINSNNTSDKEISNTTNTINSSDEIRKFKELLDEGIITEEEFNAKKKQLLGI